jgi:hypothetical protein
VLNLATEPGAEPPKPALDVRWPADLDEHDPDLASPRLPVQLPQILSDIEGIRQALALESTALVMTSFKWFVYPGMMLDPRRDAFLYNYLNRTYWPYSYAHMRRYADFQNRVFRKYAASHDLDFIDVADQLPSDVLVFDDAIHLTRAGIYLQAWIVFNGLVPAIERRLASGSLPRPARMALSSHPAFTSRHLVSVKDIRATCRTVAH